MVIHSGSGRVLSVETLDQIHMHSDQCKHIYRNCSYSDGRGELFHTILKAQGGSKVDKVTKTVVLSSLSHIEQSFGDFGVFLVFF